MGVFMSYRSRHTVQVIKLTSYRSGHIVYNVSFMSRMAKYVCLMMTKNDMMIHAVLRKMQSK